MRVLLVHLKFCHRRLRAAARGVEKLAARRRLAALVRATDDSAALNEYRLQVQESALDLAVRHVHGMHGCSLTSRCGRPSARPRSPSSVLGLPQNRMRT